MAKVRAGADYAVTCNMQSETSIFNKHHLTLC